MTDIRLNPTLYGYILLLLTAVGLSPAFSATRYVSAGNPGAAPPYDSWPTAAATIQSAIAVAVADDVVIVSSGTYTGSGGAAEGDNVVVLTNGVTLESEIGAAATIVDGQNLRRGIYLNHADVTVRGFTFINGFAQDGGGAYLAAGTMQDCVISNNLAQGPPGDGAQPAGRGGGAFVVGGSLLDCLVTDNEARGGDGLDGIPGMDAPPGMNGMTEGAPGENGMDGVNAMSSWATHGGQAEGGGVFFGHGQLKGCEILNNRAIGGNGATGAKGGNGGAGGNGADGVLVIADGRHGRFRSPDAGPGLG